MYSEMFISVVECTVSVLLKDWYKVSHPKSTPKLPNQMSSKKCIIVNLVTGC